MENIESLRNIAEYLGLKSIVSELEAIDLRAKQENASLIFFEEKEELLIPNWGVIIEVSFGFLIAFENTIRMSAHSLIASAHRLIVVKLHYKE